MASHRSLSRPQWIRSVIALVTVVIAVAIAIGVTTRVQASAEAKKHDPYGEAATAARARAERTLSGALDHMATVTGLSNSLGDATYDSCTATNATSMDLSITCTRERYRIYATEGAVVNARALAQRLMPQWVLGDSFCDADLKLDTACLQAADVALEIIVEPESKTPHSWGLSRTPEVSSSRVESSTGVGVQFTVPLIVVEASVSYFVG